MQAIRDDLNSLLLSNAQFIENDAIWVGFGKFTPDLQLSEDLSATFPTVLERIKGFVIKLFKASVLYSFFLVLTSPIQ